MAVAETRIKIAYLNNPDPIYYNKLDFEFHDALRQNGAEVIPFELDDIYFKLSTGQISFYLKDSKEPLDFDGFMFYGYMSSFKEKAFSYLLKAMEKAGKTVLHTSRGLSLMNDKLFFMNNLAKSGINIPSTYSTISINGIKNILEMKLDEDESSIQKNRVDYGGDGVKKCFNRMDGISDFARTYWNREYSFIQKFIPDSIGRSIRVLLIGGKAVTVAEYIDKSGDFRSNVSNKAFNLENRTNHEKANEYIELARKALCSIGCVNVCGVDILDSKEKGLVVLEANSFPELYDIAKLENTSFINHLAREFIEKVKVQKQNK